MKSAFMFYFIQRKRIILNSNPGKDVKLSNLNSLRYEGYGNCKDGYERMEWTR